MKKIPIVLEQYECATCKRKWYINTEDKVKDKMVCPYGCKCEGDIARKFEMTIHRYEEYAEEEMTLDAADKFELNKLDGGER